MTSSTFHLPPSAFHFLLFALLLAFVLAGLLYNVTVPLFEPPDEIWHFAFADHLANGKGLPYFTGDQKPVLLREAGQPPLYYAITALAIASFDRSDFPGFVRFNASHPAITPGAASDRPNVFIHTRYEEWPYHGAVLAVHVARLVSLLFGLLTVLGVYAIVRQIAPTRLELALVAAAITAFTPQFVLLSNAVNNDSLMAATATWTVWAGIKFQTSVDTFEKPVWQWAIALGVMLGLGLLSKLSAIILIPFAALVLLVVWLRNPSHSTRDILLSTFYMSLSTSVIAGWWYVRNIVLYGDPMAWNIWLSDIGVRQPTPALWQLLPELPALFRTYWIEFTYGHPAPWLWAILTLAVLVAIAGWIINFRFQISDFRFARSTLDTLLSRKPLASCFLLLGWLGLNVAGVVRYMQTTPASQGRLLFPAISAISLLLAAGLCAWRKWPAYGFVAGLFVLTLAAPFAFVQPAFARPIVSSLPAGIIPTQTRFGDALELIGYRLPAQPVLPGHSLQVTTYWRVREPVSHDQRLLIRLLRDDGQSGGQIHVILGTSVYPTSLWLPGEIIADEHSVPVDASLQPGAKLDLQLGMSDEGALLPVEGDLVWFTGDVAELGQLEVAR